MTDTPAQAAGHVHFRLLGCRSTNPGSDWEIVDTFKTVEAAMAELGKPRQTKPQRDDFKLFQIVRMENVTGPFEDRWSSLHDIINAE